LTRSLGYRLLAGAAIFISLALLLTWLVLTNLFETYVAKQFERELVAVIDTMAAHVDRKNGVLEIKMEPSDPRYTIPAGGRYWQAWLEGAPLLRSRSLWDTEIKYSADPEAYGNLITMEGPAASELLAFSQKLNIEGQDGPFDVVLTAAADRIEFDESVAGFNRSLVQMLALTALALLIAAALQVRFGLRPLRELSNAVANVRAGKSDRIDDVGPNEVRPLVSEINTLLMSERAAVERARARASDLAHGLKTPLTVLSQISESLRGTKHDELASSIEEQVRMVRSRTDRQLALSRIAASGKARVDVKGMVDKLAGAMQRMPSAAPLSWQIDIPSGMTAAVDPGDFAEALGNIIDNARLHANSIVKVTGTPSGRRLKLTVEDNGKGVIAANRVKILERGQRLDENTEGSGLGLAITSDIARAYGGTISLDQATIGGLSVRTEWPLAPEI
jgi:signal transduction histidine kinase